MKRFALGAGLLTLVLMGAPAQAQTGTARGKVVDEQGQPVADAKVALEFKGGVTRTFETKTNKKGEYTQVGLQPGVYRVTASKEGYRPSYVEERVSLGDPTYISDLKLSSGKAGGAGAAGAGAEIQALFNKAVDATRAGKLDEAEAAFKEVVAKDPSVPQAYNNLGFIYTERKDWAAAEAAYKKALELKPDYSEAKMGLVRVYEGSGQKDKATEMMTAGAADDPRMQFGLAVTALNAGKYDDAEAAFKKVESADSSNAEVHYYLGTIALNKGKADECIARLEKYLSMSPTNTQNVATAQGLLAALKKK